MKKILKLTLTLLTSVVMLFACNATDNTANNTPSNEVKLKNDMVVTIDGIELKDKHGDLKASSNSAAFVVSLTVLNNGKRDQGFGGSNVTLQINGQDISAEMLTGSSTSFGFFKDIAIGDSLSGDLVFAAPAAFTDTDKVVLLFTDVLGNEQGSYTVDTTTLEKIDSTPKVTASTDGTMQSGELGGVKISVGKPTTLSSDEACAEYPHLSALTRGFVYVIADVIIENNATREIDDFYEVSLYDEFGESSIAKSFAGEGEGFFEMYTPLPAGETRSGKMAWIIKDDVKELTIKYPPLRPEDKTKIEIKIQG